jgi:steroid delta-isomerase-like uncharacterized protein
MPDNDTRAKMHQFLDALFKRDDFAPYLADDVTFEIVGTPQIVRGRRAVRDLIMYLHTQAFDAKPIARNLLVEKDHAALEGEFIGTHTGDFLDIPATGRSVTVPYCMVYDWRNGEIAAMRNYTSMDLFVQQLRSS